MKNLHLEEPVRIIFDAGCDHCRKALKTILKERRGVLVITPDFNASGRVTHHHIEARDLTDEEVDTFTRRKAMAESGDVFCQTCDGKRQLS